jgi:putative alpha-1,2-mannosidase
MGAWFVFNSLGFYPNAGQDLYLIGSPMFEKSKIKLDNGNMFEIEAKYLSDKNIYIQSATFNGNKWEQAWFKHEQITKGGKLVLEMGEKPTHWGSRNTPPSLSE